MPVTGLDHLQIAMPPGEEETARGFYVALLGLHEEVKPPELARRGGCWFQRGALKVHLGIETEFRPARKAHPAFLVEDLPALVETLRRHGYRIIEDEALEDYERVFTDDPFGNRIELMQPKER
jgi:catechol 2,3-dioxygenase-like lactoylglutathione lyase family enzyme